MLDQMVSSFGASVLVARNGEEAMDVVSKGAPDLVFCDLVMPRVDGFRFMLWLRGQRDLSRTPVIAVSALGMKMDIDRTWASGFSGHLVKPIDLEIVEAQLRRVFSSRSA